MCPNNGNQHGVQEGPFTLIEVTILLAVLAVMIGLTVPASIKIITAQKMNSTKREMENIFGSIMGNPDRNNYGFVGDMGRLPDSLSELVRAEGNVLYSTQTAYQVGMGWNGPYTMKSIDDIITDGFGRPYRFNPNDEGRLVSAGADGQFGTGDDVAYPPTAYRPYGAVRIELTASAEYHVRLYYSENGREQYVQADEAPFLFENIPVGPHAVEVLLASDDGADPVAEALIVLTGRSGVFNITF
ncbi:MAG: hypothetical protein HN742_40030 [Lentisphaerae bacterium]|jgi:hypothetical protein|nr:hypothetical protein [Lentisphaerota bacterium]MBT4815743.1 hypothetical protein [Lentisphaerota bacterium]MBT5613150.1 hypothetical protein [Lentisphaerota bacterium]MBT7061934.1 hypothetical protein [Lentisphaerota bacterium]MBT7848125.1 hypothetical protein [Lentisphaerota bacterium]